MFDRFGEFDSCEEINTAAEGLKEEGDLENLRILASENGLQEYAEDYINGVTDKLCDVITAAIGKLEIEKKEASDWAYLAEDVVDYLSGHCDDLGFAAAVRKNGKRIEEAAKRVVKEAQKHDIEIPGGGTGNYCGPMKGYQLIKEYYEEGNKE